MKRFICAVRDRALDAFGAPMYVVTVGQAIRAFSDEVNRVAAENQMNAHPEDFDLYELGQFDDASGLFETHQPRQVAVGKDVKVRNK